MVHQPYVYPTVPLCTAMPDYSLVNSGKPLVPCLPTFIRPQDAYIRPIMAITLQNVHRGDQYFVYADVEFTNETGSNVMVTVELDVSAAGVLGQPEVRVTPISAYNGFNISQAMHHGVITKSVLWTADADAAVVYVQLLANAACDGVPPAGVTVHASNYSKLTATKIYSASQAFQ